eukprot:5122150-Prymnesium_polylepis.1
MGQEVCHRAEVLGFRVWVDGGQVDRDCPPSTCYSATLHIVASVRAPCPTRPLPPCSYVC